jgi:hypothetical protein
MAHGAAPPPPPKWYHQPWSVVLLLFFVLGPFGLPLLWKSPSFSRWMKIVLTVAAAVYAVLLVEAVLIAIRMAIRAALQEMDSLAGTGQSITVVIPSSPAGR